MNGSLFFQCLENQLQKFQALETDCAGYFKFSKHWKKMTKNVH